MTSLLLIAFDFLMGFNLGIYKYMIIYRRQLVA